VKKLLFIGFGGFLGALLRYGFSGLIQNWLKSITFPFGTLATNLLGCFSIGFISQMVDSFGVFSDETRAFILIGLLGAFTTFSTFDNETFNLIREGNLFLSFINVGLQVFLGLGAVWLGHILVIILWR